MMIAVQLPPEAEERLRARAERQGEDKAQVAARLILEALEWEEQDYAEAVEGIERGLADFEHGRFRPFHEFAAEQRKKHNLPSDR